ncbi:NuoI/complex I 23 kDa subunit family protein [Phosphitispora sp. TUW77]|uniref:NuoI/complex I 23 kDa subunit family protein n=1 Tax=Phosphitispora sp. TUW77 TaxID=3152361 RepID=UPI003AB8F58C
MFGQGLIKGLRITMGHFFEKKVTRQYPEERPVLAARFKGSFDLDVPKCIACGLCSNACPNHVIKIETVKDENNKKKLTGYKMLAEQCLYCGFCVEVCPTKALLWNHDYERATYFRDEVNLDLFSKYTPSQDDVRKANKDESAQAS